MPLTHAAAFEAVAAVHEPELFRTLGELGMVRNVRVDGDFVAADVAVPVPGAPEGPEVAKRVRAALTAVGANDVDLTLTPLDDDERSALRGRLEQGVTPFADAGTTRILGISSGKGGVGKSSVTVNLAIALAQRGLDVGIVDADVYGFSVPKMLGIDRPPMLLDTLIIPPVAYGVKCISMGFFAAEDQPVIWRGPMLHKALEQFVTDVYWGEPDFVLIDMPPGTGDVALSMAQFLPRAEVFVVTTPQPAAQRVAQRSALMAEKVNLTVTGVIENMSWFTGDDGKHYEIFGRGGGDQLAERLDVPLIGQVPLVIPLREGGDEGRPITATQPDSEASRAFAQIAERVAVDLAPRRIYKRELKVIS